MNRLPRFCLPLALLAVLGGGCMDFDAAYTRYCQVPFRCDAGVPAGDGGTDGGPPVPVEGALGPAECLPVGSACAEALACCSGECEHGACAPVP
ncbi:MAG TPA: hypothetical protein VK420_00815 [Longimicrobium sp.]|nr:hypothetical protein [Longimicrobium sp.]